MAGKDSETDKPRGPPPSGLPKPEKLPPALQRIVDKADKDESLYDELYEGTAPQSTDSNLRYAAYATRIRTALLSAQRYVAYTSDIGESFRPVAHPNLVRAAYGISWAYIAGDVAHEGYKAYCANQHILHPELPREASQERSHDAKSGAAAVVSTEVVPGKVAPLEDYRTVMAQRAIFQSLASMGLPAFTIHSIVRYSGVAIKKMEIKNVPIRRFGPIGLGLAAVPALPYLFDHPVETAVEYIFHEGFKLVGGKEAVGDAHAVGREKELGQYNKKVSKGEKEL
ncbi:Mitochondrial fission process protein 1 [Lachnellula arida]|uniref:Mitochondrial fission process protein 1 n=1 Tax=Lachnellula arida TaxID=1316785 RepID=A0A8T9BDK3_9HELO|nr:Mitochondrial fission process protein 1 [Lachnellula arida]